MQLVSLMIMKKYLKYKKFVKLNWNGEKNFHKYISKEIKNL